MNFSKTVLLAFAFFSLASQRVQASEVTDILTQIVTNTYSNKDYIVNARLENQLIRLGPVAVDELIDVTLSEKSDMYARWAAALALGEIGDAKAIPALKSIVAQPQWGETSWLRRLCERSLGLFQHPEKRAGKVYVYHISSVCERTDPDTGLTEKCP